MRSFGAPAVCASAVAAGIIASSSGSASVTPAPLSTVRRERCFFVRNMRTSATYVVSGFSRTARPPKGGRYVRSIRLHPKRLTRDDARHDRRQPVVLRRGASHHRAHLGHVVPLQLPPQRIHHELLGER